MALRSPFVRTALCLAALCVIGQAAVGWAATPDDVDAAIRRGMDRILDDLARSSRGERALAVYTLHKCGVDEGDPRFVKARDGLISSINLSRYTAGSIYEAACEAMALESLDAAAHREKLERIGGFIIENQLSHGGWYYLGSPTAGGDLSITQYAVLGLWAVSRAGVEIPVEVWDKAANFHFTTQSGDGGWAYHPRESPETKPTMGAAGTGSLLIIRRVLFGTGDEPQIAAPEEGPGRKRKFGMLDAANPDFTPTKPLKVRGQTTVTPGRIDKAVGNGVKYLAGRFSQRMKMHKEWFYYFLYSTERIGALTGSERIGEHRWYDEGVPLLLSLQRADGSWEDSEWTRPATCFGVLFLGRATQKVVGGPKPRAVVGGGVQIGGRGLPKNLFDVQMKEGEVQDRKATTPLDQLLDNLEKAANAAEPRRLEAAVEAFSADRAPELVGQTDRLLKMARSPEANVRRTAAWALGRSGSLSGAPVLVALLADPNEDVLREASFALCALSRQPRGLKGVMVDPFDAIPEEADEAARQEAIARWSEKAVSEWTKWHRRVRPYGERDDRDNVGDRPARSAGD